MDKLRVFLDSANAYCRPNGVLSSRILMYLERNGHSIVPEPAMAQYVICNTCGFDGKFQGISMSLFKDYGKTLSPGARLVSVGCLNSISRDLAARVPELVLVDDLADLDRIFFRTVRFDDVQEAYFREDDSDRFFVSKRGPGWSEKTLMSVFELIQGMTRRRARSGVAAAVKYGHMMDEFSFESKVCVQIGKGCTGRCNYCVIKNAKGPILSRSVEAILRDIETVAAPGKVVCLVADDCGSYGLDIGKTFIDLLREIGSRFPNQPLDVLYLNPQWLQRNRDAYVEALANVSLRAINIPIQTGSQKLLARMNRHYDIEGVLETVRTLRQTHPLAIFVTHVMVGFPGETDEDFRSTLSALDTYDIFWHFRYTDHEAAKSRLLSDKVPAWIAGFRSLRLSLKRMAQHARYASSALLTPAG